MKKICIYAVMCFLMALGGNVYAMEVDILGGIDVHGFVSQGYIESDENNYLANNSEDGTFGFNEIGINFSKQLTEKLRIGLQIFSRDLGAIGNNEIELDWAFADYRWRDWAGLRVGRIKAPMVCTMRSGTWICFAPAFSFPRVSITNSTGIPCSP